jgi:hypothetical protein
MTSIAIGGFHMAKKPARKARVAKRKTPVVSAALPGVNGFTATLPGTTSRDEIYHRLEWYFDKSHDPHGLHTIPPGTSIGLLLHGLTLQDLYINMQRASQTYIPAWSSMLFNGVVIPWTGGIEGVKSMDDLIDCLVRCYQSAGWHVVGA